MRIIPLIAAAAVFPLGAQESSKAATPSPTSGPASWDAFLARQRSQNLAQDRWNLVLRTEDAQDGWWQADDIFRRLQVTQEFRVVTLDAATARDLWLERGWNTDTKWILLDPGAEKVKELNGRPSGEQALEELRSLGFKPRWERRDAFLREHPGHGEARAEVVQQAIPLVLARYQQMQKEGRVARAEAPQNPGGGFGNFFGRSGALTFASPSDPSGATLADEAYADAAEALQRFVEIQGWTEFQGLMMAAMAFQSMGAGQSPRMRALAEDMAQQLQEELARNPHRDGLWFPFAALARAGGTNPVDAFRKVLPVPGRSWPPSPFLSTVMEEIASREDWEGGLTFLRELEGTLARSEEFRESWREYTFARASLELARGRCLARLGRWNDVGPALQEAQRWAGSRWNGFFARSLRSAIPELRGERQEQFRAILETEERPDLPEPAAPPALKLVLLGTPPWKEGWDRLRKAAALQPWTGAELMFEQRTGATAEALLQRGGWTLEPPSWVLLWGEEILHSGPDLPTAEDLAAKLAAVQPSRYQRLGDIIRRHPEHMAARRARAELAFGRMPNGHLEGTLAEDARLAHVPPDLRNKAWTPNAELWQWAALKVLPEAERELQAWPSRVSAWKLWMGWARFHPSQPSPLAFARTLSVWGSEDRWASRLPKEVHDTVAEELRAAGRFEEMRGWFQEAWDGLDKRPLRNFGGRGGFRGEFLKQRREQGEAIASPLKEALTTLRRNAEVKLVDDALRAMLDSPEADPADPAAARPFPGPRGQGPRGPGSLPGGPPRPGRGQ